MQTVSSYESSRPRRCPIIDHSYGESTLECRDFQEGVRTGTYRRTNSVARNCTTCEIIEVGREMSKTAQLNHTERRHLAAAEGWLGLGSWAEAQKELEAISPQAQGHPHVLRVRWEVCAADRKWLEAL